MAIGIHNQNFTNNCVCCVDLPGLSKWVRHLVQHHDTFSNAMQSLVAFSQVQQNVQGALCHIPCSSASSSDRDLPITAEESCMSKDVQSQTLGSHVKLQQQQRDHRLTNGWSHTPFEPEPNKKAGEINKCY